MRQSPLIRCTGPLSSLLPARTKRMTSWWLFDLEVIAQFITFMVKCCYIYGYSGSYIMVKFMTFMVSGSITFEVESCYINGKYYIQGQLFITFIFGITIMVFITFMGDTTTRETLNRV